MITQNLFNKKPKTFMDYKPGKLPSNKDWDTQTKSETKNYAPFASNVKIVGDNVTKKDYDDFFEGFNDPYGEKREQERKEKFANIRASADNRTWSSQNKSFLEGFNSAGITKKSRKGNGMFQKTKPEIPKLPFDPSQEVKIEKMPGDPNKPLSFIQYVNGETKDSWAPSLGGDLKSNEDKELFLEGFLVEPKQPQNKTQNKDAIEFGADSETYKILQDLSERWYATSDSAEKDRLHEVAEKVRMYHRQGTPIFDKHDAIMNLLHENKKRAQDYQKTMTEGFPGFLYRMSDGNYMLDSSTYLIGMVDEGEWDYKYNKDWQVPHDHFDGKYMDTPGSNYRNWLPWMYFDGRLISADKLGNMNMAYVGKNMGLPEWVYKNITTTDKDDAEWVQYGIDLANSGR